MRIEGGRERIHESEKRGMKEGEKEYTKTKKKLRNEGGRERIHESEKRGMKEGEKEYTKAKKIEE